MPKYTTKNEPIDAKPYIVYTPDKNIVYSGDPDADISGGGIELGNTVMVLAYKKSGGNNTLIGYFSNAYIDETNVAFADASNSTYAGFAGNMDIELFVEDEDIVQGNESITAIIDGTAFTDFETQFVADEPAWEIRFKMPNITEEGKSIAFYFDSAK